LFVHNAEGELLCRLTHVMIPYFNAGIYLENKAKIGKVEEILGPINKVFFSVKPDHGVNPASFKENDKFFIGTDKLLPLSRFTNESKGRGGGGRGRGPPGAGRFGSGGRGITFYP
jgi:H/ACA ribonucleoprotein complex subunit 1